MENSENITNIIIETINTIFENLFSSIDNNLYSVLDDITFINSNILKDNYLKLSVFYYIIILKKYLVLQHLMEFY